MKRVHLFGGLFLSYGTSYTFLVSTSSMGGTYMQYYKLVASLAEVDAAAARKKTFGEKAVLSAKSNEFNKHFHDRAFSMWKIL